MNHNLNFPTMTKDITFFSYSQASEGWTYYFKKSHNIVDRHVDKTTVAKPADDEAKLKRLIANFKVAQLPTILCCDVNKVF